MLSRLERRGQDEGEWEDLKLRNWQCEVLDEYQDQNDREILFVGDVIGGMGKSFLVDYIQHRMGGLAFTITTKNVCAFAYKGQRHIVFDRTRTDVEHVITMVALKCSLVPQFSQQSMNVGVSTKTNAKSLS